MKRSASENSSDSLRHFFCGQPVTYNERTKMIARFSITSSIPNGFPMALKVNGNKIHGYAIFSGLLGYDYFARNGEIVEQISRSTKHQAIEDVKDIFDVM